MSEFDYTFSLYSGTSKQKRKYQGSKDEYYKKKELIISIRKLLRDNKKSMAISSINNYIDTYGEDGYVLHELAKYYYSIGNIEDSRTNYEKVINENYPNKYYSMYELAKIEKNLSNYDKSLELLDSIIGSKHPDKCHARLERAKLYYITSRYDEYLTEVTELIFNNEPNKIYAFDSLMDYCVDFNKERLAVKFYKIIKKDLSEDAQTYYSAIIHKLQNHPEKSKEMLEILASGDSEFRSRSKYHLSIINFEAENYKEAVEYSESVLREEITMAPSCYRVLANLYVHLKDFDKTKYYIEQLKECGGYQENLINELYGSYYFNQQQYDEALKFLLKVEPVNKSIYYEALNKIGCIYIKQNKYKEALEYFEVLDISDCTDKFKMDCLIVKTYLKKQLGLEIGELPELYTLDQIIDYSKEEAIKHIETHKRENEEKAIHSVFNEDIDICELYDYALEHATEETYWYNNFMDIYIVDYPNIGKVNGKEVNSINIVTLPNTKQIITMYPYNKPNFKTNQNSNKVKKMSRSDKFKQKYGLT